MAEQNQMHSDCEDVCQSCGSCTITCSCGWHGCGAEVTPHVYPFQCPWCGTTCWRDD
jgi:hypothetical protein